MPPNDLVTEVRTGEREEFDEMLEVDDREYDEWRDEMTIDELSK